MRRVPRRGFSISVLLLGGIGGIVLIGLAIILALGLLVASDITFALIRDRAHRTVDDITHELHRHLAPAARHVGQMATLFAGIDGPPDAAAIRLIRASMAVAPQIRGTAYFAPDGWRRAIGRDDEIVNDRWADTPAMRQALRETAAADGPRWAAPAFSPLLRESLLIVRQAVRRGGRPAGFVATVVTLKTVSEFLDSVAEESSTPFVLYGADQLLAHPVLAQADLSSFLSAADPLLGAGQAGDPVLLAHLRGEGDPIWSLRNEGTLSGRFFALDQQGEHVLLTRRIESYGAVPWTVGVHFDTDESDLPQIFTKLLVLFYAGAGVLAATLALLYLIARRVRRPVRELAALSQRVQSLDLAGLAPVAPARVRELDEAADAFNAMVGGLRWFETYVPKSLARALIGTRSDGDLVSREQIVTVMFTDIAGFTPAAAGMTPQATAALLNAHFTLIARAVEAEGGTIDKYIGDSVMAFWGAPMPQPDHAARACRAVLAVAESLRADNRARAAQGLAPLRLRIGLHSGPAIVGNIGAPGRINYTIVGDTVNIANRLEQLGREIDPDAEICAIVSGETAALLPPDAGLPAPRALPARSLRGVDRAVEIRRLV